MVAVRGDWVACEMDERLVARAPRMQMLVNECVKLYGPVHHRVVTASGAYVYAFGTVRGEGLTQDILVAPRWLAVQEGYTELADTGWEPCGGPCGRKVRVEEVDGVNAVVDDSGSSYCYTTEGGRVRVHQ